MIVSLDLLKKMMMMHWKQPCTHPNLQDASVYGVDGVACTSHIVQHALPHGGRLGRVCGVRLCPSKMHKKWSIICLIYYYSFFFKKKKEKKRGGVPREAVDD